MRRPMAAPGSTRPCSISRRGGSRIPSWPPTPARRSGCGAARPAGSLNPSAFRRCLAYFERMYDQRWSPEWVAQEFDSTYKDLIFQRILETLGERVRSTPRTLLDVGCHAGRFLQLAGEAGWVAEGTEINERTATHAAARTGVPVHRLSAERLPELGRQYNAVTLTDVLEHIPEPVALLSIVRRIVTDGGWVAIKVPCGPAQLLKETWRARLSAGYRATLADNLVHINHFSPRALRLALERAGFDEVTVEIAAPGVPARRREHRRSFDSRCTTSVGVCPAGSTRRSRCTCRRLRAPGRLPAARRGRRTHDGSRSKPVGRHPDLQQRGRAASLPDQLAPERRRLRRRDHRDRGRVPRRHARVSRGREPVGVGATASPLHSHGRCPRAAVHERGAVGRARAADDGLAGRHVRHRGLARPGAPRHLPRP